MAQGLAPFGLSPMNYDDPRYQRKKQRLDAKGGLAPLKLYRDLVSEEAGRQYDTRLALQQVQQKKMNDDARWKYKNAGLDIERANMNSLANYRNKEYAMNRSDLKSRQQANRLGMLFGIGTAGYSAYEGNRRRKIAEADADRSAAYTAMQAEMLGYTYDPAQKRYVRITNDFTPGGLIEGGYHPYDTTTRLR